jgi:peptidoglycan/LPS O-acetylase OafA/YrhL
VRGAAKFRNDIQALRGIAVLLVILFHAFPLYFPGGYIGVDLFFVISGFVVSPLIARVFLSQNPQILRGNLKEFYQRRFYRLGPSLGITLIVFTPLIFFLGNLNDHERFYKQGLSTIFLLGNFGANKLSGDYFSPRPNPLLHTWSLSAEEQIYLLLPICIFLVLKFTNSKFGRSQYIKFLFGLNLLILTLWGIFPNVLNFYSPIFRVLEFSIGAITYHLTNQTLKKRRGFLVLFSLGFITWMILFDRIKNQLISGIVASLLIGMVIFSNNDKESNSGFEKILIWFGDRSYSLYLVHMPIIYLANYSPFIEYQSPQRKLVLNFAALILTITLGAIQYKLVEQKFRIRTGNVKTQQNSMLKILALSIVIPLMMMVSGLSAFNLMYFGLRHENPPPYGGVSLTKICKSNQDDATKLCSFNLNKGSNVIYLVGDSHAAHLAQPLIKIALERNWGFISSGDVNLSDLRKWQEMGRIVHVVYSQYWHTELLSQYKLKIQSIKDLNVPLLVVAQSPTYPDETLFMNQRSILNGLYVAPKKFRIIDLKQEDLISGAKLIEFLRSSEVNFLNPMDFFCDKNYCSRWDSAGWLYSDDDHFSPLGAMKLYKPLADAL